VLQRLGVRRHPRPQPRRLLAQRIVLPVQRGGQLGQLADFLLRLALLRGDGGVEFVEAGGHGGELGFFLGDHL